MIQIILSDRAYENDVYPLVKSFFPQETIKISQKEVGQAGSDAVHQSACSGTCQEEVQQGDQTEGFEGLQEGICLIGIEFFDSRVTVSIIRRTGELSEDFLETASRMENKPKYKNAMKRLLYRMLAEITGKVLPWGILTGIRPTKLAYEMLEEEVDEYGILKYYNEEYLCSKDKAEMSIRIAQREMKLLRDMDYRNGYSLYIGIPFCPSTCLYCSFPSYSIGKTSDQVDGYLEALHKEIIFGTACFPDKKLTTVYIGGGTPTSLDEEQLDRLLGQLGEYYDFSNVLEFCVEAGRPDSITEGKLKVMKKWGVDRISINPQSMQQKTLDLIGRKHTVGQVVEAFRMARETGHDNINMDLIIGLPGENPGDVRDTLLQVKELDPDSLTVHTLALKRAARLNAERDQYAGLRAVDVPVMLEGTIQFAGENHYLPYYLYRQKNMADNLENIGYAKSGKEGLYNILIMEEKQTILALGAAAMTKYVFHKGNRIERVDNVKSIRDYIGRIDEMIMRKQDFLNKWKQED